MKISILRFKAFQVLWVGDGMKYVNVCYNASSNSEWLYFESWKFRWVLNGWWVKPMYFQLKSWKMNVSLPYGQVIEELSDFCGNWWFDLLSWNICILFPFVCEAWISALYTSSHGWTSAAVVLSFDKLCWMYITSAALASVSKNYYEGCFRMT